MRILRYGCVWRNEYESRDDNLRLESLLDLTLATVRKLLRRMDSWCIPKEENHFEKDHATGALCRSRSSWTDSWRLDTGVLVPEGTTLTFQVRVYEWKAVLKPERINVLYYQRKALIVFGRIVVTADFSMSCSSVVMEWFEEYTGGER